MTLFGIGPVELLIILALALVVLGPTKLPEAARSIAKVVGEFRRASQDVTAAVTRELDMGATPPPTTVKAPALPQDIMKTITLDTVATTAENRAEPATAPAANVEPPAPAQAQEVVASPASSDEDSVTHG